MARSKMLIATVLAATVSLVGGFEGLRTYAYRDPVGIPTICFGETRGVHMGDTDTVAQCKQMLGTRLLEFAKGVDKCIPWAMPDKSYEAFVSLAYNVGTGALCRSSIPVKVRAGDLRAACNTILDFNKALVGGQRVVLPGLDTRRHLERDLCLEGVA